MGPLRALGLRDLGTTDYRAVLAAMRGFTNGRDAATADELWMTEHTPVFTQGQAGRDEHVLAPGDIAVVRTDRGGQVTYHGPGQLVGYPIIDLRRWGGGPLKYVSSLEQVISESLAELGIEGTSEGHPTGVWVEDRKVAAIGVKVGRRVTTHGFALNVSTDLSHFKNIVPCGMPTAKVTSVSRELGTMVPVGEVLPVIVEKFGKVFGYSPEPSQVSYNRRHKIPAAN